MEIEKPEINFEMPSQRGKHFTQQLLKQWIEGKKNMQTNKWQVFKFKNELGKKSNNQEI